MAEYIFVYHMGTRPETPQAGKQLQTDWRAWAASIGDAMVHPGTVVSKSYTVSASGTTEGAIDPLAGYSIVAADSIEAALKIAESCPHTRYGTIEVAETMEMPQ